MNTFARIMTSAAASAVVALTAAGPAQAQYRDYDYGRDTIDTSDIVRGVAVAGAAAAAIGAITGAVRGSVYGNGNGNYGYGNYGYPNSGYPSGGYGYPNAGYGYGNQAYGYGGERYAIDACAQQAQRFGRVQLTEVDRKGSRSYRVKGFIEAAGYNGGYNNVYNRGYNGGYERRSFKCTAREDGRVTDFDTKRY